MHGMARDFQATSCVFEAFGNISGVKAAFG
jgi:hypothetical protein